MARSSAATVAPPAKRRKPSQGGSRHASTQTHRRPARRSSGPSKGGSHARQRPVAATQARAAAAPAPAVRRDAPRPRTAPRKRTQAAPLVRRLIHGRTGALIDGLLRGRACVGIVFVLLVGVVFSNVSLLEMNKGIAATNAQSTAIEQENSKLRRQIAPLSSSERIQTEAVKRGYSLPAAGDVGFLGGDVDKNAKKAVARMTAPGMGEGTASRPAAQVEQQEDAEQAAQSGQVAPTPQAPTTPVAQPTPPTATSPPATQSAPPTTTQP